MRHAINVIINLLMGGYSKGNAPWIWISILGLLPIGYLLDGNVGGTLAIGIMFAVPMYWWFYGSRHFQSRLVIDNNSKALMYEYDIPTRELATIDSMLIEYWPENARRWYIRERNHLGGELVSMNAALSLLPGGAIVGLIDKYKKRQQFEDDKWTQLFDDFYKHSKTMMLVAIESEIRRLPALEQNEINQLDKMTVLWRKKTYADVHKKYGTWTTKLEAARVIMAETVWEVRTSMINDTITYKQARKQIQKLLNEANKYFEESVPTPTARGAVRYMRTLIAGK